jgi:hypothetical protein
MYECVSVCVCFVSAMGFPNTASLYTTYVYTCVCVCVFCVFWGWGGVKEEKDLERIKTGIISMFRRKET